jgi:hypothetical protein
MTWRPGQCPLSNGKNNRSRTYQYFCRAASPLIRVKNKVQEDADAPKTLETPNTDLGVYKLLKILRWQTLVVWLGFRIFFWAYV